MAPGAGYNVKQGTLHNVVGRRDVQWLIVESQLTPDQSTEFRPLSGSELKTLCAEFPQWVADSTHQ